MPVVRLRGTLKQYAGGEAEHPVDGGTVADVLRALEERRPGLKGSILDERGRIRRHINVFVDGEPGDETTAAGDAESVDVLPAISGGAR